MKKYFFDTESIGFFSPTVLIQYAVGDGEPKIHNIFKEPVKDTLSLIEDMVSSFIVGFNLTHDWYHISRTYGCLSLLPKNKPPLPIDIFDVENTPEAHDKYCLKPSGSLDLMLYGRQHELQATMNQKPIVIRRVPTVLAHTLVKELTKRINIPKLYFAKKDGDSSWKIKELGIDGKEMTPERYLQGVLVNPDLVNIRLDFHPSTGLKPIVKYLLGKEIDLIENMLPLPKVKECSWFPCSGSWLDVAADHITGWTLDERRIAYAIDDVHHTRDLYHYFKNIPETTDPDSDLACMVGAIHWKGYHFDKELCQKVLNKNKKYLKMFPINYNAPRAVKEWVTSVASPMEKMLIKDTSKDTLKMLKKEGSDAVARRARHILTARAASKKVELLEKLLIAGRMYVTLKVTGTKSNRMSGGSMFKKGGSINPQGIKKGSDIRNIMTLHGDDMELDNGDFDGFEVSIAEAVYQDVKLREDLLSGKKIHALWGMFLYKKTYEEMLADEDLYNKAKTSFFAKLYGAFKDKIAKVTGLTEAEVDEAEKHFESHYEGIGKSRIKTMTKFQAMSQPKGIGTAIIWKEPVKYAESFLGFRRYFDLEFSVIETLYNLAQNPTEEMSGVSFKVVRKDRLQTASGAVQSALYGAAFSLNAAVIRAGLNHEIQSPGGQITKQLGSALWGIQPKGIYKWFLMPLNIHDEIECPRVPEIKDKVKDTVMKFIEEKKVFVPLMSMTWKQGVKSWGEK